MEEEIELLAGLMKDLQVRNCYVSDEFGNQPPCVEAVRLTKNWKADAISSPIEDGTLVFDNKVVMPTEATVEFIVAASNNNAITIGNDYEIGSNTPYDCLELLKEWFNTRTTKFFKVLSKFDILEHATIIGMSEHNDPQKYDAIGLIVTFREVKIVKSSKGKVVKEDVDSPIQDSGSVSGVKVDGLQIKVVK